MIVYPKRFRGSPRGGTLKAPEALLNSGRKITCRVPEVFSKLAQDDSLLRFPRLADSSDTNHRDDLPPIYKRRMVWTSSEGSEADAASSLNASEATPFVAREDATADLARELDLPEDSEPSLVRKLRIPAANEANASNWQDVTEPFYPEVKIEEHLFFGPDETENLVRAFEQTAFEKAERKKRKKNKKVVRPNPPGSSLSIEQSLSDLRARFGFGNVTLRVPSPNELADDPPEGFLTLHLIGILVRGYETESEVTLAHLQNYLEIRRVPKSEADIYYISPAKNRKIIEGFPSKADAYTDYFFFVALENAVLEDLVRKVLTKWGILGSLDIPCIAFQDLGTASSYTPGRTTLEIRYGPSQFVPSFPAFNSENPISFMKSVCTEKLFGAPDLLHEIFAVERLSYNDEPFHSDNFVCEPRLNLFVHRSDRVRQGASEYYQGCSREIDSGVGSVLSFRLELRIPFRRLRRGVVRCDHRTPSSSSDHEPFLASSRFFNPSRIVLLAASAWPFPWGYRGVDLLSRIPHLSQKPWKRVDINCKPLSVTIS
ncbi:hypothetical protein AXX17_ATUG00630 [Arabidopsis thaliana]|uniref:Uncharacterized protein n=1 Tax=Arabidopsis thaliana TaxID=3702 RepID=A0A178U8E2_ARATH|nr:hypothetical protein AXX17_ATUG00630 [Arabidopsis thaliana]